MPDRLRESIASSEIISMGDYEYFIHPLADGIPFIEPGILEEAADRVISMCDMDCDFIVTPEAMGIPLATAVSMRTGIPYTVVRKRRYGLPGEVDIAQSTGYSNGHMYINGPKNGDRVVVIDDVLSTGGTMRALLRALKDTIGCTVVDAAVIFCKGDSYLEIEDEFGIRIKRLVDTRIEGHRVLTD